GERWDFPNHVEPSRDGHVIVGWSSWPLHMGSDGPEFNYQNPAWTGFGSNAKWSRSMLVEDASFADFEPIGPKHLWDQSERACIEACIATGAAVEDCVEQVPGSPWTDLFGELPYFSNLRNPDRFSGRCAAAFAPHSNGVYIDLWTGANGAYSPDWLASSLALDVWESECAAGSVQCQAIADGVTQYWEDALGGLMAIWNKDQPVVFDDPLYLREKFDFLGEYLSGIGRLDRFDAFYAFHLNGESGELPYLPVVGFRSYQDLDNHADTLVALLDDTWRRENLGRYLRRRNVVVNIDRGGRALARFAELAANNGYTIATHGPIHVIHNQFLQHLPHVRYDGDLQAYVEHRSENRFGGFHFDNEYLQYAFREDTAMAPELAYRQFRWYANAGVALGATSMLFEEGTLGYMASYVEDYYDGNPDSWADWLASLEPNPWGWALGDDYLDLGSYVDPFEATEHLEWLGAVIGRAPETSPEAFCMMTSHGHEVPTGVDVEREMAVLHLQDDWGQHRDIRSGEELGVYSAEELGGTVPSDSLPAELDYLRSPRTSHYGRYIHFLPALSSGQPAR
ncbi:MAG: hypothetical protein KC561_16695, partial [Myxococcales bacterium]|nr:hypothetical protein [Myxococcales bacterium]